MAAISICSENVSRAAFDISSGVGAHAVRIRIADSNIYVLLQFTGGKSHDVSLWFLLSQGICLL